MSHTSGEACWICGEPTKNRCGACEEAGIDIFFCSREHQKLVWPVHRLVCGPGKAKPFSWPLLSAAQAAEAVEHCDVPAPLKNPDEAADTTLTARLKRIFQIERKDLPFAISTVTADSGSPFPEQGGQALLCEIIATEGSRKDRQGGFTKGTSVEGALSRTAGVLSAFCMPAMTEPQETWFPPLAHHLLLHTYLNAENYIQKQHYLEPFCKSSFKQVERCIMEGFAMENEAMAADMLGIVAEFHLKCSEAIRNCPSSH